MAPNVHTEASFVYRKTRNAMSSIKQTEPKGPAGEVQLRCKMRKLRGSPLCVLKVVKIRKDVGGSRRQEMLEVY